MKPAEAAEHVNKNNGHPFYDVELAKALDLDVKQVDEFIFSFAAVANRAWQHAEDMGFHDARRAGGPVLSAMSAAALMHSEISEFVEVVRTHKDSEPCEKVPAITNGEEEIADLFIRAMDTGHEMGMSLARAILVKMAFNRTRGKMHGGKLV